MCMFHCGWGGGSSRLYSSLLPGEDVQPPLYHPLCSEELNLRSCTVLWLGEPFPCGCGLQGGKLHVHCVQQRGRVALCVDMRVVVPGKVAAGQRHARPAPGGADAVYSTCRYTCGWQKGGVAPLAAAWLAPVPLHGCLYLSALPWLHMHIISALSRFCPQAAGGAFANVTLQLAESSAGMLLDWPWTAPHAASSPVHALLVCCHNTRCGAGIQEKAVA